MSEKKACDGPTRLRENIKALANRYAVEILRTLSPSPGGIIPELSWEDVVIGVLRLSGYSGLTKKRTAGKTREQADFEEAKQRITSGGTLYDSMKKLVAAGYIQATGESGKKNRRFRITYEGRLALAAISTLQGEVRTDTEMRSAATLLLKHKNFIRLLPAQERFLEEVGEVRGNLLIQMPPGSGKTFLAMMVVLNRLEKGFRCLYVSPYLSLTRQIIDEYGELLNKIGYTYIRYDGQSEVAQEDLEHAHLVVGIYESVLNSILEGQRWTEGLSLVVIDELPELSSQTEEVHAYNLGTDRSAKIDYVISFLKQRAQLIALSSRFGETERVAEWLNASIFRPSVRLTPDEFTVRVVENGTEILSSDGTQRYRSKFTNLTDAVLEHIRPDDEKSLLFVAGSRAGAEMLAASLAKRRPLKIAPEVIEMIMGKGDLLPAASRLKDLLEKGVAFHHAGLDADLRGRLETAIRMGAVKTVASTTGITSGTSFPFDSVILMLTPWSGVGFNLTRSRYLQIAGRIGEYHLSEHGGTVYVVYHPPIRQFDSIEKLQSVLLHGPIEPIVPEMMDPSLFTSVVVREAARQQRFTRDGLEESVLTIVAGTLAAAVIDDHAQRTREQFNKLFRWLEQQGHIVLDQTEYQLAEEERVAIDSGLGLFDLIGIRDRLKVLGENPDTKVMLEVVLATRLVQSARPRTVIPSQIEMDMAGLEEIEKWYMDSVEKRTALKELVLHGWVSEKGVAEVITSAVTQKADSAEDKLTIGDIDEGDLSTLVQLASDTATSISQFLDRTRRERLARRFKTLSRQLRYGCKEDMGESDLFELRISDERGITRGLLRSEARTLFEHGYKTIDEIVHRDIDPSRSDLARDRFARNCGLDSVMAKTVYRAALDVVRTRAGKRR
ncbi:MAG: DEAD/DEAH box helicase [Candidatus Thorarchaeota archaeon]|nr:DEAD/DEAH box helicase [Candidatus Thorarchaeota archaeon]